MSRALLAALIVFSAMRAFAQAPGEPPDGYGLHDERTVGPFTVQRWVNSANPSVSASGMCDCVTIVLEGGRHVMTFGSPGTLSAYTLAAVSGADINGDGLPDLVMSAWSGGAHCCFSSAVYSVGEDAKKVLTVESGNCGPGAFEDLDGNGTQEFITCDDRWASTYCSFADSPLPRVIYSYNASRGEYVPDTPHFAGRYRDQLSASLAEAQTWLSQSGGQNAGLDKCHLLRPALGLMYSGHFYDGIVLIRGLYRGADREQFERETIEKVRSSPLWVER